MRETNTVHTGGADLPDEIVDSLLQALRQPSSDRARAVGDLAARHPGFETSIRARAEAYLRFRDLEHFVDSDTGREGIPRSIGPYEILEVIGEGGMGRVYRGRREGPVAVEAAIKIVRVDSTGAGVLARFELERQALSLMHHSAIARILDAGATETGEPWLAMEYVPGDRLLDYCDVRALGIRDRLLIAVRVCLGVEHAHQRGIIHRDLKPSNILVAHEEGEHLAKIIDFGLARAVDRDHSHVGLTHDGRIVGTPAYMAPEQAQGLVSEIDTRTDVYGLGITLYELLTGTLPFAARGDTNRLLADIIAGDPPKPSVRFGASAYKNSIASVRDTTPRELMAALRKDLDWIVMRAIARRPEDRYQSPRALAEDLSRLLAGEPVEARPPTFLYSAGKFVTRYRNQAVAAAGFAIVLVLGLVGTTVGFLRAEQSNQRIRTIGIATSLKEAVEGAWSLVPTSDWSTSWSDLTGDLDAWITRAEELAAVPRRIDAVLASYGVDGDGADTGDEAGRRDPHESFVIATLVRARGDLAEFHADDGLAARVRDRARWARAVRDATVDRYAGAWDRARAACSDESGPYEGLELAPQEGLVPLGANAAGLQEFYHLRSGWDPRSGASAGDLEIPERDAEGRLGIGPEHGIVFVLLPGGAFTMGSAAGHANYLVNPDAHGPYKAKNPYKPHRITLDPFFVAAHELTQGQWARLESDERRPSTHPEQTAWEEAARHPVESVSLLACRRVLARHGLAVPTEAQWEYAARGGTRTERWFGDGREDFVGCGNILDDAARRAGIPGSAKDWDDGFVTTAPVGRFRANGFGLYDVTGNVWEWVDDRILGYDNPVEEGTGRRIPGPDDVQLTNFVTRGGGFRIPDVPSAYREELAPGFERDALGVRPVRALLRAAKQR